MSLRLGSKQLVNLPIKILPSIFSEELQFHIIRQRGLSAQITGKYGDKFSIMPKKKKGRKTTGNYGSKGSLRQSQVFQLDPLRGKDAPEILESGRQQAISGAILRGITDILNTPELDSNLRDCQPEITRVKVTPDFGQATIYWAAPGESEGSMIETVQNILDESASYIRRLLPAYSSLTHFPQLTFTKDNSTEYKAELEYLLNKAKLDDTADETDKR